jgi:hypothetical protein
MLLFILLLVGYLAGLYLKWQVLLLMSVVSIGAAVYFFKKDSGFENLLPECVAAFAVLVSLMSWVTFIISEYGTVIKSLLFR